MKLPNEDRLLAEVQLEPVQGSRFQPTGFPSLGAAEFTSISNDTNTDCVLVESVQSMANRLEDVCWDKEKLRLADALSGMPVITVNDKNSKFLTNSLLEAHRMNSSYMLEGSDKTLNETIKRELQIKDDGIVARIPDFARFVLRYDPNSLLHGLFLSRKELAGGRYKMTRILSSFIEATNVKPVVSGGVKFDFVDPSGGEAGAESGFGHIPYPRTEYSAESIVAYFNVDISLLRSYGLSDVANNFLFTLALWKIRFFLKHGLRLRTACDLKIKKEIRVSQPRSMKIPDLDVLSKDVTLLIKKCKSEGLFTEKPLTVTYSAKKADKK
ncbi:MAG: type I-U CRISPR-associated RAMP protein Csb1/Cas7u [Thaumarchaeota archaeon]|nr:type I-U CRISPR-associated RAMP protein Csb1/Cas7u [Nitrososphaerota archaeon]